MNPRPPLTRTIFTATRLTASDAPAVLAVREAIGETARRVAARRGDVALLS